MMKKRIFLLSLSFILIIVLIILDNKENKKMYLRDNIDNKVINNIAFYLQESENSTSYVVSKTIPAKDSGYIFKEATCKDNSTTINFDSSEWAIYASNMTKGITKCSLYFDIDTAKARDYILANKTVSERTDFSTILTSDTTGTIYQTEDDDGTSYYYGGAPTDNWFYFGGYYWRIIRINGDGTIRLIYNGTSTTTTGTGTQIGTSAFNSSYNNNAYVGYMYTSGSVHGLGTSSTIKEELDDWYNNNLSNFVKYIDFNVGFCNDRQPSTSNTELNGEGGTGTTTTYYGANIRLDTNKSPTLKCIDSNDLFTNVDSSKGNKTLTKPIGLITADEVAYAGGVNGSVNSNFYLYTKSAYWTISPYRYSSHAYQLSIRASGNLGTSNVENIEGVRPVINIKKDVELTGTGTSNDPYRIIGIPEPVNNIAAQTILANKTISTRTDFSTPYTATTTNTIFSAEDDDGTSYYFAGSPTDNYVKFAGLTWRIVRINGDNTIRLVLISTALGKSSFNNNAGNNAYVGYMYTSGSIHGFSVKSDAYTNLEKWYNDNLSVYSNYIDYHAGFCNDRDPSSVNSSQNGSGGTGTTNTWYAGYFRSINKKPSFKCANSNDLFTSSLSSKGNKALDVPIGLITMDEILYAGGVDGMDNSTFYLNLGSPYWTMTPRNYDNNRLEPNLFYLEMTGMLTYYAARDDSLYILPVINLKADVTLTGSGTNTDPYIVS